ncbi:MAG: metal-dependent transcriptional regulator [Flavobacteriaceae bacterium]
MTTQSEENYLKAIYHLGKQGTKTVSTNAIADKIETKASSVTDMLKKLAEKKLVNYIKYQGATLTEQGQLAAALVVRKHRLWEVFLVEKLDFSWDEVHDVAEQLEHIKSLKLTDKLEAFLKHPTHDPHGDPIPNKQGQIAQTNKVTLAAVQINQTCVCVGVRDSSKSFLNYLNKKHIALGSVFKITGKEAFDESMLILHENQELNISKSVSNNLFVKITN